MPPKKKRKFNLDDMEVESEEVQTALSGLAAALEACNLCEVVKFMNSDEVISFAVLKFGYKFVCDVFTALKVIPVESGAWRSKIVKLLVNLLTGRDQLDNNQEYMMDSLLRIENFSCNRQGHGGDYTYCDQIYNKISVNNAVNTNPKRKYPIFAGCIAPPTASCVRCNGELTKHNSPSYYRINGPLPFLKVELRCRTCMEFLSMVMSKKDTSTTTALAALLKLQTWLTWIDFL